jgi:hypothetical protein
MKANEAPEKIYVDNPNHDFWYRTKNSNSIEYTRTDTFIEKALKFLDEKFYFNNLHYCIESGVFDSEEEMFEDFKNYMKGE